MGNNNLNNEQNNMMNNNQEPRKIIVEQPKSNVLLITFLLLIIFALAGYIIWDKLIKKEEKEPVNEPKQEEKVAEKTKDEHNYYATETVNKTVNGKETKFELKYWLEKLEMTVDEDGELVSDYMDSDVGYFAHADLFVNNNFVESVGYYTISYSVGMEETYVVSTLKSQQDYNKFVDITKEFNIVKGDKEYLYQKTFGGNLLVFNDSGEVLFDKEIENWQREATLDKTCPNYEKFVGQYNKDNNITNAQDNESTAALYYVREDFIYYVEDLWKCEDNGTIAEYKITFSNDKANLEKIADCKYEAVGACG